MSVLAKQRVKSPAKSQPAETGGQADSLSASSEAAMDEYFRLQQRLLIITLTFSGIIFASVWFAYSLHTASNYLIGACTGVVYLRMLSRSVAKIGKGVSGLSSGRLALVAAVILIASQWNQLEILPVFLGFLTYKAALIGYVLWTAIPTD